MSLGGKRRCQSVVLKKISQKISSVEASISSPTCVHLCTIAISLSRVWTKIHWWERFAVHELNKLSTENKTTKINIEMRLTFLKTSVISSASYRYIYTEHSYYSLFTTGDKFRKSFPGKREYIVSFQVYFEEKGQGILRIMSWLVVSSNGSFLHLELITSGRKLADRVGDMVKVHKFSVNEYFVLHVFPFSKRNYLTRNYLTNKCTLFKS